MVSQIVDPQVKTAATQPPAPLKPAAKPHGFGFHDILSALNPLQYVPVVGTIYRSATGDTIPENTRMIGSMVVSFLTGGPIGVATSAAATAVEKATGIDPEKIGHNLLAKLGIGHAEDATASIEVAAKAPSGGAKTTAAAKPHHDEKIAAAADRQSPISPRQLAAYGVKKTEDGELAMGDVSGADVLNTIELHRLAMQDQMLSASSAYAAVQRPASHFEKSGKSV